MRTSVADYLDQHRETFFDEMEAEFNSVTKLIRRYKPLTPETRLLEIGTGTGWFQIRCKQQGIICSGLDVDADLAAFARELGQKNGVTLDIQVSSLEGADLGVERYDVIVADSTFEHVEGWRAGLEKVATALKPGGVFYFASTNKFSFQSGEYWVPLYGWLPDAWRYALRRRLQGDAVMQWGIDFNQFTYPKLRRVFKELGFTRILDQVDVLDPDNLTHPSTRKRMFLKLVKSAPPLKHAALCFSPATLFICVK
jgi:SAM-dependent methyltransferase